MLFNSYTFIFAFLPVTLLGYYLLGGKGYYRTAIGWLVVASLVFYGWWNANYLGLILLSMSFNFSTGLLLDKFAGQRKQLLLIFGVTVNLALIAYFKYANFFLDNLNLTLGSSYNLEKIILPLAISFFTFQQIAYLVDAYRGETREHNVLHYSLFVTFFPQLIAGPIVHHKEMLPQFAQKFIYKFNHKNLAIGLTIFTFGLFKKVVIADSVSAYATPVFAAAESGVLLTFFEAWGGTLAYTLQLYFDFSGYSDMAIGLARMFGIRLPANFYSPYKSVNIIEFWARWHITLSRFLKDYIYIPLGGNRKGSARRYVNLMMTMLIGGLWHGAGWTFIIWGALHGFYLMLNHFWHAIRLRFGHDLTESTLFARGAGRVLTILAVMVGWTFFRAESIDSAFMMISAMAGANEMVSHNILKWEDAAPILVIASLVALFMPNTLDFMSNDKSITASLGNFQANTNAFVQKIYWKPTFFWALAVATAFTVATLKLTQISEFLYFQF